MPLPSPHPDHTCLVTGASSGIGVQLATELASRRLGVTLVARRAERLIELAADLATRFGVRAEVIVADLAEESSRTAIVTEVEGRGLTVDLLVNNAGFSTTGPVAGAVRDRELAMVRTDVEAVVDLCTLFVPGMVERGAGAVLNVASTAAFQPLPSQAGYAASKAFVLSYTESLGGELKGTGVSATALCPGPVRTEFAETAGFGASEAEMGLPKVMWVSAEAVARAGIEGVEKNKAVVIPGAANSAGAVLSRLTPHGLLVPLLAKNHPALKS